jgi:hypothetical protein
MLTNNVKKEITIALEELLLAKMLMRTSDTHNKSHKNNYSTQLTWVSMTRSSS